MHIMRIALPVLFVCIVGFVPVLTHAAPPPAGNDGPPNAVPPTSAPTEPLPVTSLPDAVVTSDATTAQNSETALAAESASADSAEQSSPWPIIISGAAVVLVLGVSMFVRRRRAASAY